jgi:hypothetical protein
MAYVILRTEKYKTRNTIAGLVGHHLRIPGSKLDNVDLSRSHLNVVIGAHDRDSFNKAVRGRIATCTRKPRPDANKVVEMMLGASPEFFEGKSYEEQKAYLYDCLDFAKQFFGEANIVGAYMHFDESTPHLSILAVPIETSVRKTKKMEREVTTLNASHFFAGKDAMIQMQTDVALFVQARGHDLLRGEPKSETRREHEPLGAYWKKQAQEIDAAAVAAADHLDDAAIKSRVASDLLAVALDEAQRTGFEAQAMAVQRGALNAERAALEELREAMKGQGAAVDKEWNKLRARVASIDRLEADLIERSKGQDQITDIARSNAQRDWDAAKLARETAQLWHDEMSQKMNAFIEREGNLLTAEKLAELVKRPELLGMLEFLSERQDARDLLALLKADPAMGEMVRQNIELAVGMGSQLEAADWTKASNGSDWGRVLQSAVESQKTAGPSPFN